MTSLMFFLEALCVTSINKLNNHKDDFLKKCRSSEIRVIFELAKLLKKVYFLIAISSIRGG